MGKPKALITGISGQTGAYLAKKLLEQNYDVVGTARRTASGELWRLKELGIEDQVTIETMELTEQGNIDRIIKKHKPEKLFHLAAQSFVGDSFECPIWTGDANAIGTARVLESLRNHSPNTKYIHSSTSEMFGKVQMVPQNEMTQFYPRSPYGVAKQYAHWIGVNYRESYSMFCSNLIAFNHECVTSGTPILFKCGKFVDIKPIDEIVPHKKDPRKGKTHTKICKKNKDCEKIKVWDGCDWTNVTAFTANWKSDEVIMPQTRGGVVETTGDHVRFLDDKESEINTSELKEGDRVWNCKSSIKFHENHFDSMTKEKAWLLGLIVADGHITKSKDGNCLSVFVTGENQTTLLKAKNIWEKTFGTKATFGHSSSGFNEGKRIPRVRMSGLEIGRWLHKEVYNKDKTKRIPKIILNSSIEIRVAFLKGFSAGDGLKNKHYEVSDGLSNSFKTTSPTLALGICYILRSSGKGYSVYHQGYTDAGSNIFQINAKQNVNFGQHLAKDDLEIRKISKRSYDGWVFDLATESKRFMAGVGETIIHNSPIRGKQFVTRKITNSIAKWKLGKIKAFELGNMDAKRDWSHADDIAEAYVKMLEHDEPMDLVVGSGVEYSVREFVQFAFDAIGQEISFVGKGKNEAVVINGAKDPVVTVNPKYYRPCEVDTLLADPRKIKKVLNWRPKYNLKKMIEEMVEYDLKKESL